MFFFIINWMIAIKLCTNQCLVDLHPSLSSSVAGSLRGRGVQAPQSEPCRPQIMDGMAPDLSRDGGIYPSFSFSRTIVPYFLHTGILNPNPVNYAPTSPHRPPHPYHSSVRPYQSEITPCTCKVSHRTGTFTFGCSSDSPHTM